MQYHYAILGGTFDRFHAGHKALICAACSQSEKVDIGITTEKFYKNKVLSNIIEQYETREQEVKKYLTEQGFDQKTTIVQLENIYGNALKNREIEALFVTQDTEANAKLINQKRLEQGFPELQIISIPFVLSEDNQPITAERIRRGEINREGKVYKNLFQNNLQLPETLREELRKPIGKVITSLKELFLLSFPRRRESNSTLVQSEKNILITVGDIVTLAAIDAGLTPILSIIDFKTQRQKLDEKEIRQKLHTQEKTQKNDPGTIKKQAVEIVQQKIDQYIKTKESQVMLIDGEEDLLTLPVILLAPLETKVIYGQVGQGAVIVTVSEELKEQIANLIKQFN